MNYKALLIVIVIIAVVDFAVLYALKGNPAINNSLPASLQSNNITLPTNPNQVGVNSVRLAYNFNGRITETKASGDNIIIKLDSPSQDSPQFVATPRTLVFTTKGSTTTQATLKEIKLEQNVILSDSYDIKTKTWTLDVISIQL